MGENRGHDYILRLGPEAEGDRLLPYLAAAYPHSAAGEWEARIRTGLVQVDGRTATPDAPLRRGQTLCWRRPAWEEPAVPATFAILHRDLDLLAVAKPAGLPTLPGAGFLEHTLLSFVRAHDPDAAPVHRLGRFTSGVVLFGLNREARADLGRQWGARSVGKRYRALATGSPASEGFSVHVPIGPIPHPLLGSVHAASPSGRPATTEVRVLNRRDGAFLCDVLISTGRPHQIRIHLAAAGHPLVGDPLYGRGGVPAPGCHAVPGDPGYLLHAAELRFRHPRTGSEVVVGCAPPPELRGVGETLP